MRTWEVFTSWQDEPLVIPEEGMVALLPNTQQVVTCLDQEGTTYWIPWPSIVRIEVRDNQNGEEVIADEQDGNSPGGQQAGGDQRGDVGQAGED